MPTCFARAGLPLSRVGAAWGVELGEGPESRYSYVLAAFRAGNIGVMFRLMLRHLFGVMFSHFFKEACEHMAATSA